MNYDDILDYLKKNKDDITKKLNDSKKELLLYLKNNNYVLTIKTSNKLI